MLTVGYSVMMTNDDVYLYNHDDDVDAYLYNVDDVDAAADIQR